MRSYTWLLPVALSAVLIAWGIWRARNRPRGRIARWGMRGAGGICGAIAVVAFAWGGYSFWFCHRGQPQPTTRELFEGVEYVREVEREPAARVVHVVRIDLEAAAPDFFVTPPEPLEGRALRARTTSHFLEAFDLQLAINASYFDPFFSRGPFDFYPREGDPVDALGPAASGGVSYGRGSSFGTTLAIDEKNDVTITSAPTTLYDAVAGKYLALEDEPSTEGSSGQRHPRTVVALDDDAHEMLIVVVDGRQPGYSEGATFAELAEIVRRHGGDRAVNLDGGGSTALVVEDAKGRAKVLNSPIHTRIPGRERPVANHLGMRLRRTGKSAGGGANARSEKE